MFDDPPPPGSDHVGKHDLAEIEDASHVDREHLLELFLADRQELRERGDAGVVDQDRRGAELFTNLSDPGLDRGAVAHVDCHCDGRAAVGDDLVGGLLRAVAVAVEDRDRCALLRQTGADGDADAGPAARHDRGAGPIPRWYSGHDCLPLQVVAFVPGTNGRGRSLMDGVDLVRPVERREPQRTCAIPSSGMLYKCLARG